MDLAAQLPNKCDSLNKLSIIIPARDEAGTVGSTVEHLHVELMHEAVPHEIIVVDDGSTDDTAAVLHQLKQRIPELCVVTNTGSHGFGKAIIRGLDCFTGDAVVVFMADASDSFADVVKYWCILNQGVDCVFGSRFVRGGVVTNYPLHKLIINRLANLFIACLFRIRLNDTTNAFKGYRREVIEGCRPFLSHHFNLTVELPLKAIVRGFSWSVVPISWSGRQKGVSKLKIREMGSRYLFIVLYCWLERMLARGDYRKRSQ